MQEEFPDNIILVSNTRSSRSSRSSFSTRLPSQVENDDLDDLDDFDDLALDTKMLLNVECTKRAL